MSKTIYTEKTRPTSAVQGPRKAAYMTKLAIRQKNHPPRMLNIYNTNTQPKLPARRNFAAFSTIFQPRAGYMFVMKPFAHRALALLTLLTAAALGAAAQERRVQNKPYLDMRRFHYGFCIGLHDQGVGLENNGYVEPETGAQWMAENNRHNWGFQVGVLGEWKMTENLALRLVPSMYFGSKSIRFVNLTTGETQSQDLKSTYIALPVLLKVSAPRFNNYRPYVIAGVQPMYDLTTKKQELLMSKKMSATIEVGLGCDLYLPYFKLIPELKFSIGLGNILEKDRRDLTDRTKEVFTRSVSSMRSNMVSLTFYFE